MQRILSTKNPREASMMSAVVNVVLNVPRYFMITGLTILALVFYSGKIRDMGASMDFEMVLPDALSHFVPAGLLGILIAGLLAAFMSNFAATVNSAPPYLINDIYRKFINPQASERLCVRLSYVASFAVVALGITFGFFVGSIDSVIQWIVSALWGGYTAANVLKWYWWRFNGYGYFYGMVAGIGGAMVVPEIAKYLIAYNATMHELFKGGFNMIYTFPVLFVVSVIGCIAGTLLTDPEDEAVLKKFYKTVNPWGWWGPIRAKVMAEDPGFVPNRNAARDLTNVAVGIVWQLCLVTLAIFIVLQQWAISAGIFALLGVTSVFMKFNWYDKLEKAGSPPAPAR